MNTLKYFATYEGLAQASVELIAKQKCQFTFNNVKIDIRCALLNGFSIIITEDGNERRYIPSKKGSDNQADQLSEIIISTYYYLKRVMRLQSPNACIFKDLFAINEVAYSYIMYNYVYMLLEAENPGEFIPGELELPPMKD